MDLSKEPNCSPRIFLLISLVSVSLISAVTFTSFLPSLWFYFALFFWLLKLEAQIINLRTNIFSSHTHLNAINFLTIVASVVSHQLEMPCPPSTAFSRWHVFMSLSIHL